MRRLFKWIFRLVLLLALLVAGLLLPVGYVEMACIRKPAETDYAALLPEDHHRPEARTLLTYPEWHIVHAYDDYAKVIAEGDPHEFGFLRAIRGFWASLCELSYASADHGGMTTETKQMVYTIGVSFTAEMLAKAAYEETLGRLATLTRDGQRARLDDVSADQAARYAEFLQQVPWYKWDFAADAQELADKTAGSLRDTERVLALGLEYATKMLYARVIEQAVANVGADALTLRMVVGNTTPGDLARFDDVTVIGPLGDGIEIETPRYRQLTLLLERLADAGVTFTEIAGNDDILLTAISPGGEVNGALYSFPRQGYGDMRHLILLRVPDLAEALRDMRTGPLTLEHIHDY